MSYKIIYDNRALEDTKRIPKNLLESIREAIDSRLTERPYDFKTLRGKRYRNVWRLRVSKYRIAYKIIEDENTVCIMGIDVRSNIYEILDGRVD